MQCLTQTIEPSATALTEQSILAHNPPYGLVVAVYPLESFQPFLHAPTPKALPIPLAAAFLYHLCQLSSRSGLPMRLRYDNSRCGKPQRNDTYPLQRSFTVLVDHGIFHSRPHLLSICSRKSRSSCFSILRLFNSLRNAWFVFCVCVFLLRRYSLSLFSPGSFNASFYLCFCQADFLSDFPMCFPFVSLLPYVLHVVLLSYTCTPCCSSNPTSGGTFSQCLFPLGWFINKLNRSCHFSISRSGLASYI